MLQKAGASKARRFNSIEYIAVLPATAQEPTSLALGKPTATLVTSERKTLPLYSLELCKMYF